MYHLYLFYGDKGEVISYRVVAADSLRIPSDGERDHDDNEYHTWQEANLEGQNYLLQAQVDALEERIRVIEAKLNINQ